MADKVSKTTANLLDADPALISGCSLGEIIFMVVSGSVLGFIAGLLIFSWFGMWYLSFLTLLLGIYYGGKKGVKWLGEKKEARPVDYMRRLVLYKLSAFGLSAKPLVTRAGYWKGRP